MIIISTTGRRDFSLYHQQPLQTGLEGHPKKPSQHEVVSVSPCLFNDSVNVLLCNYLPCLKNIKLFFNLFRRPDLRMSGGPLQKTWASN